MTETPSNDGLSLRAKHPEHCHECYRLIPPGEIYNQTKENTAFCKQCVGRADELLDTILATDEPVVDIYEDYLTIRRGETGVEVRLNEVRHLVDAMLDAAVRLVNHQLHGSLEPRGIIDGVSETEYAEEQLAALAEVRRIVAEAAEKWRTSSDDNGGAAQEQG